MPGSMWPSSAGWLSTAVSRTAIVDALARASASAPSEVDRVVEPTGWCSPRRRSRRSGCSTDRSRCLPWRSPRPFNGRGAAERIGATVVGAVRRRNRCPRPNRCLPSRPAGGPGYWPRTSRRCRLSPARPACRSGPASATSADVLSVNWNSVVVLCFALIAAIETPAFGWTTISPGTDVVTVGDVVVCAAAAPGNKPRARTSSAMSDRYGTSMPRWCTNHGQILPKDGESRSPSALGRAGRGVGATRWSNVSAGATTHARPVVTSWCGTHSRWARNRSDSASGSEQRAPDVPLVAM